jgi:hypothetical protein
MKKKLLLGIVAVAILILGTGATAQAQEVGSEKFRERMIAWAWASEQAFQSGEPVADKIAALSNEQIEIWLSMIEDPDALLTSLDRVVEQLQGQIPGMSRTPPVETLTPTTLTTSFTPDYPPDYPPGSGPYKSAILDSIAFFSIGGASITDRCSASDWGNYVAVWWPFNKGIDVLDGACVVAGCDPTGVVCGGICGILEAAKLALKVAAIPLEACDVHQGAIDGAEIEATYENTKGLVGDVSRVHDDLSAHDTDIKALLTTLQASVDANSAKIDTLLARQLETIRLLHTPQGRRTSDVPACNGGPCAWP